MIKNIFFSVIFVLISSCSFLHVHKPTIEQGNIIQPAMLKQIRKGMSKANVQAIMGTPILANQLDHNTVVYVYTLQSPNKSMHEKKVILNFHHNRLRDWQVN